MRGIRWMALAAAAVLAAQCGRKEAPEPPLATPSVTLSRARAALGSPIDITYRFEVAPSASAISEDYRVFVGVVDADETLMWTDDHDPPVPTTSWKPGQKIEYTRTVFIPVYPYVGDASIHMGLYSVKTKKRVSLSGLDVGQRAYRVAALQLLPQTDNVFLVFKDGWHRPESPPDNTLIEWQWTKKEATIGFRNPRRDSVFEHEADNPSRIYPEGQRVQLTIGGRTVDEFTLMPGRSVLRKIPLTAGQLGDAETVEIHFAVDKAFVPALVPAMASKDPRELGIRV